MNPEPLTTKRVPATHREQRGSIIQTLKDDPDLRSAREVIADPARYRSLLQPKK